MKQRTIRNHSDNYWTYRSKFPATQVLENNLTITVFFKKKKDLVFQQMKPLSSLLIL